MVFNLKIQDHLASILRFRKLKIPRGYQKLNPHEETIPAFKLTEMDLTSDFYLKSCGLPIIGSY